MHLRQRIYYLRYREEQRYSRKWLNDKDQRSKLIKFMNKIVTPNEQTLRLHEELESTRQILNKLS